MKINRKRIELTSPHFSVRTLNFHDNSTHDMIKVSKKAVLPSTESSDISKRKRSTVRRSTLGQSNVPVEDKVMVEVVHTVDVAINAVEVTAPKDTSLGFLLSLAVVAYSFSSFDSFFDRALVADVF